MFTFCTKKIIKLQLGICEKCIEIFTYNFALLTKWKCKTKI
ncbi:hypothetical protein HMPREF1548_05951 [Clostridium sp. KLE 1755]|nr:hypothetical protein HMPREF1548_05951 [Clostridium sp. KLE 1755]